MSHHSGGQNFRYISPVLMKLAMQKYTQGDGISCCLLIFSPTRHREDRVPRRCCAAKSGQLVFLPPDSAARRAVGEWHTHPSAERVCVPFPAAERFRLTLMGIPPSSYLLIVPSLTCPLLGCGTPLQRGVPHASLPGRGRIHEVGWEGTPNPRPPIPPLRSSSTHFCLDTRRDAVELQERDVCIMLLGWILGGI